MKSTMNANVQPEATFSSQQAQMLASLVPTIKTIIRFPLSPLGDCPRAGSLDYFPIQPGQLLSKGFFGLNPTVAYLEVLVSERVNPFKVTFPYSGPKVTPRHCLIGGHWGRFILITMKSSLTYTFLDGKLHTEMSSLCAIETNVWTLRIS